MFCRALGFFVGALLFSSATPAPLLAEDPQIGTVIKRVYSALVRIRVVTAEPKNGRMEKFQAAGSGFIITPEGHVVTNHHVAGNATHILCDLADRQTVEADLVATDPLSDVAVVKLRRDQLRDPDRPLSVAFWCEGSEIRVGDPVFAMGSPAAVSQSVTRGIVSNTEMIMPEMFGGNDSFRLEGESVGSIVKWIAHDARIFGGNSGGPLVNTEGRVIGINEIGLGSLGGAIPSDLARNVVQQLIERGRVRRSWIGVNVQPRFKFDKKGSGVLVCGIIPGSPAALAGVKPGDVITRFDGVSVDARVQEQLPQFNLMVMNVPIGKKVDLQVLRGDQLVKLSMTTAERERVQGVAFELLNWGIVARDLTRMMALEHHLPNTKGVFVDSLRAGGPAAEAKPGLEPEDVIVELEGKPVDNIGELRRRTEEIRKERTEKGQIAKDDDEPTPVILGFERGGQRMMTVVHVGPEREPEHPVTARKPWLAIDTQVLTRDLARSLGLDDKTGVIVTRLYPGRAGEKAGLKRGDIILAIDGTAVDAGQPEHGQLFETMISRYAPDSVVDLEVIRGGKEQKLSAKLEISPPAASRMKRWKSSVCEFVVRNLAFEDRVAYELDRGLSGVLVVDVQRAGWAALAGLQTDDIVLAVDGQPMPDVKTLEAMMKKLQAVKKKYIIFFVRRGLQTLFLEFQPKWEEKG
jgi:serine protease Do